MNYLKAYIKLVRKAQRRDIKPKICEKHHVFPVSIYGKNPYIVKMTPREHYIAHALLHKAFIKRYGKGDQRSIKMTHAFWCMHMKSSSNVERYVNSRLYEKIKQNRNIALCGQNNPMYGVRLIGKLNPMFGKTHMEETRKKISEKAKQRFLRGECNPMKGKTHSEESRRKMSLSKIGVSTITEEGRKRISEAGKNRVFTDETLEKMRLANLGEKNPMFGKTTSLEVKEKIAQSIGKLKWFNDGIKSVRKEECPLGFKPGRLSFSRKK